MRMFIMTHNNTQIINIDFVERICIAQKDDATLIVLSYSAERPAVTLGRYATMQVAQNVMDELFSALVDGQTYYIMPDRKSEESRKKDARTKRKGGS